MVLHTVAEIFHGGVVQHTGGVSKILELYCCDCTRCFYSVLFARVLLPPCPHLQDVLRDNLEPALGLLADTIVNPRVLPEEVEEQKAVSTSLSFQVFFFRFHFFS